MPNTLHDMTPPRAPASTPSARLARRVVARWLAALRGLRAPHGAGHGPSAARAGADRGRLTHGTPGAVVLALLLASVIAPAWGQPSAAATRFSFATTPGALAKTARPLQVTLAIEPRFEPDGAASSFDGEVRLRFAVQAPMTQLELHGSELTVEASTLDGRALPAPTASPDGQRLRWAVPSGLAVGEHELHVRYRGRIGTGADGLYRLESPSPQGTRHVLATQMEPTGARRLLPLWDEPVFRVPFTVSVVVPVGQTVVANGESTRREPLPPREAGGPARERWHFETTPAMPSYLLAMFIGPFDSLEDASERPHLRVLTMPGRAEEAALALQATRALLREYTDYFGQPYTLPKLDQIALPGGFGGAMENWGAIAYHEAALLHDPQNSPPMRRMEVWSIVAHEVAHQWFGNLVTMAWWDNLWLNEGFATWIAARAAQKLNPADPVWAEAALDVDRAMEDDAMASSLPVRRPVRDDREAFASFDAITYQKGMAFIRMLEQWLGPEVFRDGLRRYMAAHAMGNTTTADLWHHLEAASGRPVADIADRWVRRRGMPVVSVASRCEGGRLQVALGQSRFALGAPPDKTVRRVKPQAPDHDLWPIPLTLGRYDAQGGLTERRSVFLREAEGVETFEGCGGLVKANVEGAGYYRSRPSPADAARLTAAFATLPETDRLNLMTDTWALVLAGQSPASDWLRLVERLGGEPSPAVWQAALRGIDRFDALLAGQGPAAHSTEVEPQAAGGAHTEPQAVRVTRPKPAPRAGPSEHGVMTPTLVAWRARLAGLAAQRLDALGLQPRASDGERDLALRDLLIGALGRLDHAPTVAATQALWRQAVPPSAATIEGLPASIRQGVLQSVGRHADAATFAALRRLARTEGDAGQRELLWHAVGSVRDDALAREAAAIALTDEAPPDHSPWLLASLADAGHPALAWSTLTDHAKTVTRRMTPWERSLLAPAVLKRSGQRAQAEVLLAWQRQQLGPTGMTPARRGADTIRVNAALAQRALPVVKAWAGEAPR